MEDTYTITHAYHTEWVGNIHTGMAQYTRSFKTINLAEIWFENYGKKIEQMFPSILSSLFGEKNF